MFPGTNRIAKGNNKNILKTFSGNYSRSKAERRKKEKETLKPKQKQ